MIKRVGLVFGGSVLLQGRPNRKILARSVQLIGPVEGWVVWGWLLIFKFHRVFSSYVSIPAFARGDQFHRLSVGDS